MALEREIGDAPAWLNIGDPAMAIYVYFGFFRNIIYLRNRNQRAPRAIIYRARIGDRIHSLYIHPTRNFVFLIISRLSSVRFGNRFRRVASIWLVALSSANEFELGDDFRLRIAGAAQVEGTPEVPTQLPYLNFGSQLAFVGSNVVTHARRSLNFNVHELEPDGSLTIIARLELTSSWRPSTDTDLLYLAFIVPLPALRQAFAELWNTSGPEQTLDCWKNPLVRVVATAQTRPRQRLVWSTLHLNIPFFDSPNPNFLERVRQEYISRLYRVFLVPFYSYNILASQPELNPPGYSHSSIRNAIPTVN